MPETWKPDPYDDPNNEGDDEPVQPPVPGKPSGPFRGGGMLRTLAWGFSGLILTALVVILALSVG